MNGASRAALSETLTRALFAIGALALVTRLAVGCATTEETNEEDVIPGGPDASSSVTPPAPAGDGAASDAEADANADADAAPRVCTSEGWCYTSLPATDSYDASTLPPSSPGVTFGLRSVWVAPDSRVWVVSTAGHVLLWEGSGWRVAALVNASLRTIWGSSASDLWIAGERGMILRGTVTGNDVTFQRVTIGTTQTIARITGTSATDVWAIADGQSGSGTLNRVFRYTAASAGQNPAFAPMTVPSSFTHSSARMRVQAIWLTGEALWLGGYETTSCGPIACKFQNQLVAMKWNGPSDAGPAWDFIPLLRSYSDPVANGITSTDGVQLLAIRGSGDEARLARIADDGEKLDASASDPFNPDGGIAQEGSYAWTSELAHAFGSPNAVWATNQNDIWLVGKSGVVRHFDGTGWRLVPLSLTNVTPLLRDLYDIQAGPMVAGEREIWVVGDDVALRRKVKQ